MRRGFWSSAIVVCQWAILSSVCRCAIPTRYLGCDACAAPAGTSFFFFNLLHGNVIPGHRATTTLPR